MPHFHPGKKNFIFTLHILRQSLDWPLISILTFQSMHQTCSGSANKNLWFNWQENHILQKFSKVTFWKVKNDIASKLSASKWPITRTTIAQTLDPKKKKKKIVSLHIVTHLCQFMAQNSKIWGVKKSDNCDSSKILNNWHFLAQQTANQWLIQKTKPKCVEYSRAQLLTDSWSNQWMWSTL